jgi:DNA-binding MarR family transcriptional regulator
MSPGELAEHERVQPPSMTRTVAALVALGLVTRTAHPVDRRQAVVALAAEGEAVVRETRRRRDVWLARRLAELTPRERQVLAEASEILRRVAAA